MKKIMFNDTYCLTSAVLQKRKTTTRRTSQKLQCLSDLSDSGHTPQIRGNKVVAVKGNEHVIVCNLPFQVGEVVAIAQKYKNIYSDKSLPMDFKNKVYNLSKNTLYTAGIYNKMFVKAEFMPHQIKITRVRLQRLQNISDVDCIKEGICKVDMENWRKPSCPFRCGKIKETTPRKAYAELINKVSGKGTWERNPYVLAYEFELVK